MKIKREKTGYSRPHTNDSIRHIHLSDLVVAGNTLHNGNKGTE